MPNQPPRIGYLKQDRQERFNMKRAWFVNAWRIVDAQGRDRVQPWANTKTEARATAKALNIKLLELKREDFSASITAEGYMLTYKGQPLGGTSILGKYKGNQRTEQIREYGEDAKREISHLVSGDGQARFKVVIEKIELGNAEETPQP